MRDSITSAVSLLAGAGVRQWVVARAVKIGKGVVYVCRPKLPRLVKGLSVSRLEESVGPKYLDRPKSQIS